MHPYPHLYRVDASAVQTGAVTVTSAGLPDLETAPSAVRRSRRRLVCGRHCCVAHWPIASF